MATRLLDDNGCSIWGKLATWGRPAAPTAWVRRSLTTVGSVLERQNHRRQAGQRRRLDLVEEGDTVEKVLFQWAGDELFDLFGRESERLGLDFNHGRGEFREGVTIDRSDLHQSEDDRRCGQRHDHAPELQTQTNDPNKH